MHEIKNINNELIKKFIDTIDVLDFYSIDITENGIKLQGKISVELLKKCLLKYTLHSSQKSIYLKFSTQFEGIEVTITLT